MTRFYNMDVLVSGFNKDKFRAIVDAWLGEWPEDGAAQGDYAANSDCTAARFTGEGYLYDDETEEEFADRLSVAIWEANGGYCLIKVEATLIEESRSNYTRNKDDYIRLARKLAVGKP